MKVGFSIAEEYGTVYTVVFSSSELNWLEMKRTMVIFVLAVMPECCFVIVEFEYCSVLCFRPWLL